MHFEKLKSKIKRIAKQSQAELAQNAFLTKSGFKMNLNASFSIVVFNEFCKNNSDFR